jgi:hypothetical protein
VASAAVPAALAFGAPDKSKWNETARYGGATAASACVSALGLKGLVR